MLLVAEKGRRGRGLPRLPQMGSRRRHHRRRHRRRQAAHPPPRRGRRRNPQSRTGRRSPHLRPPAQRHAATARAPSRTRSLAPIPTDLQPICSASSPRPTSAPSAGSGSSTITWSAPTPSPAPAPTPPSCASRKPARPSPCRSMATAATATSPRAKARSSPSPNAAAISPLSARCPVAATNNLNFGNPERPEIMAQLVEAIEGIAEACRFFETPITGGNVSLYNETLGEGIYPTPGPRHRRPDEDRASRPHAFQQRRRAARPSRRSSAKPTRPASAAPSTPK